MSHGYFGVGIENGKTPTNYGTLYRTAQIVGADFLFIIGKRFGEHVADTMKAWKCIPVFSYASFEEFYSCLPYKSLLVGIEMLADAPYIENFWHPERAVYLLGAEDKGLSKDALTRCDKIVRLRGERSMNVAVAGSIVLYDRITKQEKCPQGGKS